MKYLFFFVIFITASSLSAQSENKTSDSSLEYSLIAPLFPGGKTAKNHFISSNIQYPAFAIEYKIQGAVELRFIVEEDGSLTNFRILKDPGGGLGDEALRIYQLMPKWIPGQLYHDPTRVPITETLYFKLNSKLSKE